MEVNVIKSVVFHYKAAWADDHPGEGVIHITTRDVINAPVNNVWKLEDVDKYPNGTYFYDVTVTKVYENGDGAILIVHVDDEVSALWVEY